MRAPRPIEARPGAPRRTAARPGTSEVTSQHGSGATAGEASDREEGDDDSSEEASGELDGESGHGDGEPDRSHRTLGKACMYGADGQVIHAPAGRDCTHTR